MITTDEMREKIAELREEKSKIQERINFYLLCLKECGKTKSNQRSNKFKGGTEWMKGVWKKIAHSGMTIRDVYCLRFPDATNKELAAKFGVSESRARQIKYRAFRMMRHPKRIKMAREIGIITKEETEEIRRHDKEFRSKTLAHLIEEALKEP